MTEPQSQGQECNPRPSFKAAPAFFPPPTTSKKTSVHLILLQFHLSPPKPPNQHPPCSLKNSHTHTHTFLFAVSSLKSASIFSISRSHTLTAATRHLLAPHHHKHPIPPPTLVTFLGCVFHALVAGQAPGDFPRWGLKFGQEPVVWSDVRAGTRSCVCGVPAYLCVCMCRST